MAEKLFRESVAAGRIQFRLRLDGRNWRMPFTVETMQPENAEPLMGKGYKPVEKSLFDPFYKADLNGEERSVAVQLDGDKALTWWHRNVARSQYGIQGWQRQKIYPDFIFAVQREGAAARITVLETKGDHLDNPDTAYKRSVLDLMAKSFAWSDAVPAGELALIKETGETVACELILMKDIPTKLPAHFG
jgi:type III restriction enzyme